MPSGHAYAKAVRTVKTCVGTDFCRFGLGDAMGVGIELERAMEGLYTPHKVKSAVTGCPRNCAEAYVKDIGLVAVEGGWELYVGGAAGATVRKGDLLATVPTSDEAIARRARLPAALPRVRGVPRAHLRLHRARRDRAGREPPCSTTWTSCSSATGSPRPPPTPTRGASATPPSTPGSSRSSTHDRPRRHLDPRRLHRGHPAAGGPQHDASTDAGSRSSGCSTASPRSTRTARTPAARWPTGSSPTRASPARCTGAASTSTAARRSTGRRASPCTRSRSATGRSGCGLPETGRRARTAGSAAGWSPRSRDGRLDRRPRRHASTRSTAARRAASRRACPRPCTRPTARRTPMWRASADERWRTGSWRAVIAVDRAQAAATSSPTRSRSTSPASC